MTDLNNKLINMLIQDFHADDVTFLRSIQHKNDIQSFKEFLKSDVNITTFYQYSTMAQLVFDFNQSQFNQLLLIIIIAINVYFFIF